MDAPRPANRLAGETSLYLRQHMHNPVDWWPWCEEALAHARELSRPLLISIGYSSCHWCHVMEQESFEDPELAALINAHFVPIKVDREERPDVDQVYMDVLLRLQGHGGWPLTVFCKPGGEPFHAGTYFPPEPRHGLPSFRQILLAMARAWNEDRERVEENARRILAALEQRPRRGPRLPIARHVLERAVDQLLGEADPEHGGFGAAPKFPTPTRLELLLAAEPWVDEERWNAVQHFLRRSCEEMARRGLYDQLGGGFHRYCVDTHWGIPHFEKMLYDQGPLLRIYTDLWRRSGCRNEDLIWPVVETARWLEREMRAPDGGWYASQDADSEGVEGKFYVWTPAELENVLGPERAAAFGRAYGVTEPGNFDGANVLWDLERGPRSRHAAEREALLRARTERVPPATDTKRVTAWIGLTISGLAYAGSILDQPELLRSAAAAADFVLGSLREPQGRLLRIFAEGEARQPGFLDDHAALLGACLDLFRAGAGSSYLQEALGLAEQLIELFFDRDEEDFFLAPADGGRLVHRPRSDADGATPHSGGLAVLGLLRAASLSGRADLRDVAERVLHAHASSLERMPAAFPTLLRALGWLERGLSTALVIGPPEAEATQALARAVRRRLAPDEAVVCIADPREGVAGLDPSWLAGREPREGRPTVYLCRGRSCSLPATTPAEIDALDPV